MKNAGSQLSSLQTFVRYTRRCTKIRQLLRLIWFSRKLESKDGICLSKS